jgi:hypothetical protein
MMQLIRRKPTLSSVRIIHSDGKQEDLFLGQALHLAHEGEHPKEGCITAKITEIVLKESYVKLITDHFYTEHFDIKIISTTHTR